jgi:hypothetical protein
MTTRKTNLNSKKLKDRDPAEIQRYLADAWMNIWIENEDKLGNPLSWPPEFAENPHLYLSYVMTRPEYFSFICKEILNIQLLPVQAVDLVSHFLRGFIMS